MRRKIFLVVVLLTMGFLILYGVALHFAAREFVLQRGNMFRLVVYPQLLSMGLYFASMLVSLLAIFAGVGTISSEVDTGILHSIVPKPIKRREIILGKFLGYSLILIVYTAILFLAVVGLVQLITGYNTGNAGLALLYFLLLPLTLLALTMLGSTMLSTMANGIAVFMLYSIGTVGGMMEQIGFMIEKWGSDQYRDYLQPDYSDGCYLPQDDSQRAVKREKSPQCPWRRPFWQSAPAQYRYGYLYNYLFYPGLVGC